MPEKMSKIELERYYDSLQLRTEHDLKEYFKKYPPETLSDYDWFRLTVTGVICSAKYIDKFYDKIDWEMMLMQNTISERIIEKYISYVHWYALSLFQKLSWEFIQKHKLELSIDCLIRNTKLAETNYYDKIKDLYEQTKEDPVYTSRWEMNRSCSRIFRDRKSESSLKDSKGKLKAEDQTLPTEKVRKPRLTEKRIMSMTKAQLKEELDRKKIKYLYKDTLEILQNKLKSTLGKNKNGNLQ